jgi:hypothetical protein
MDKRAYTTFRIAIAETSPMSSASPSLSIKHPTLTPDGALFDDDNREWTADMFARAGTPSDVLPPEVQAAFAQARERP